MVVVCPFCKKRIETNPGVLWVQCTDCKKKINLSALGTTPKAGKRPIEQDLAGKDFGKYHLEELIGIGGMGVVYRATDENGKNVAVKILYYSASESETIRKRFDREIEILEDLDHKNIVKMIDKGEHENYMYIVMEYIPDNLALRLKQSVLSNLEIKKIISDVIDALSYAHKRKIIHRDLKPTNILLSGEGAKISDFGIAHIEYDKDETSLTQTAAILGTFNYMSPEQRMGEKDIDRRSDIYSLGVLLYELLTGRVPIGNFSKVSSIRKDIPKKMDAVIEKALSQDRSQRYESIEIFEKECMMALAGEKRRSLNFVYLGLFGILAAASVYFFLLHQNNKVEEVPDTLAASAGTARQTAVVAKTGMPAPLPAVVANEEPPEQNTDVENALGELIGSQVDNNQQKGLKSKSGESNDGVKQKAGTSLVILTKPPAKVLIDGKDTGRTTPIPKAKPLSLSPGQHTVTFVLPSGESHDYNVKIKPGQQTRLVKNLTGEDESSESKKKSASQPKKVPKKKSKDKIKSPPPSPDYESDKSVK